MASGDEANVQERCEGRPGHTAMLWTDREMDRGFAGGAGSPAGRGILGRGWAGAKAWRWEWHGSFRASVWPEHEV